MTIAETKRKHNVLKEEITKLFDLKERLNKEFENRNFTPDGRLIGDIGEVLAELYYDIILDKGQSHTHDGETPDGQSVQIKISFQDHLTFGKIPKYYLGLKIDKNGDYTEVYNGPGQIIYDRYKHRKHIGDRLLRFPMQELIKLNDTVPENKKIKKDS
jgi:hypothetical protein